MLSCRWHQIAPAVPGAPRGESERDSSHPHQHGHHNTLRSCSWRKNLLVQVLVKPEIPFWNKLHSETRAGMCVQAAREGRAGATAGTPAWCHVRVRGECVALVRATGQVCTSNLEELSWALSCLGISALSCACQSGGTLPIPWSSWCSSNQILLLDKTPCLCFHNTALKSEQPLRLN